MAYLTLLGIDTLQKRFQPMLQTYLTYLILLGIDTKLEELFAALWHTSYLTLLGIDTVPFPKSPKSDLTLPYWGLIHLLTDF